MRVKEKMKEKFEGKHESTFEEKTEESKDGREEKNERRLENEVNEKESSAEEGKTKDRVVEEVILETCSNSNIFPNCFDFSAKQVEDELPKSSNAPEKSWQITTLIPSSELVCGFKGWDSSDSKFFSKINSLDHEEKEGDEEECPQEVAALCEHGKNNYALESKGKEEQANLSIELANFSNVEDAYGEFFRFIFDPGANETRNSRSNSLEEGGNDMIQNSLSMWKEFYKDFIILVPAMAN